jgi:uncharacterized membrane protein
MRKLSVYVPRDAGDEVLEAARDHEAVHLARFDATVEEQPFDLIITCLSNRKVESFLERLEPIDDLRITFFPQGILALKPPPSEAPDQVTDVEERSPIETFLAGHQSIGAWTSFLGYAAAAGAVVWIGLFAETIFLLTAAMLLAPFAGPAMNAAIATASGDGPLLRKSLLRYVVALATSAAVALLLSLVFQLNEATTAMVDYGQVSPAAALLPLTAGVAGALFLTSSDRSSLVSGASVGVLVAASLAPPIGIVGMATAIGRWDLAVSSLFVVALQLVGINLSGAVVFRLFGLSQGGARYETASPGLFQGGIIVSTLLLCGLLAVQFSDPVVLERPGLARRAKVEMEEVLQKSELAEPIEVTARFPQAGAKKEGPLLGEAIVLPAGNAAAQPPEDLRRELARLLQERLRRRWPSLTSFVDVSVLHVQGARGKP